MAWTSLAAVVSSTREAPLAEAGVCRGPHQCWGFYLRALGLPRLETDELLTRKRLRVGMRSQIRLRHRRAVAPSIVLPVEQRPERIMRRHEDRNDPSRWRPPSRPRCLCPPAIAAGAARRWRRLRVGLEGCDPDPDWRPAVVVHAGHALVAAATLAPLGRRPVQAAGDHLRTRIDAVEVLAPPARRFGDHAAWWRRTGSSGAPGALGHLPLPANDMAVARWWGRYLAEGAGFEPAVGY